MPAVSQQVSQPAPAQDTAQAQQTGTAAASNAAQQSRLQGSANQVSGQPLLELNSRGRGVSALQNRLNELGATLTADGDFGARTMRAVRGFQNANRLPDDGVVGPRTAAALNNTSAKRIGTIPQGSQGQGNQNDQGNQNNNDTSQGQGDGQQLAQGQLTSSFSASEFACHDGSATPARVMGNLRALAQQLEILKEALGGANIHVNSGYRSPRYNSSVGGAENSQHLYGQAADIVVSGYSPRQVGDAIERLIREGKMRQGGMGRYSTFIHYDTRGTKARW